METDGKVCVKGKKTKFNFWPYFAERKLAIFLYIFSFIIEIGFEIFATIYIANIIVTITEGAYMLAVKKFIIVYSVYIIENINSFLRSIIYTKTSNAVINAMRVDIAEQAFKVSDKAYSEHNTSNFTQRISSDPATIFRYLSSYVSYFSQIITHLVVIIYICTFSAWVGLVILIGVILTIVIERLRKKAFRKNWLEQHSRAEKSNSLLNEIVRSQKDIKSLDLESKLKVNIHNAIEHTSEQAIKTDVTNRVYLHSRNIVLHIITVVLLVVSLYLMDKNLISLAIFMVIYSNRHSLRSMATIISEMITFSTEIDLARTRISELYEDDSYELEKFGKRKLKHIKGQVEFRNVSFSYSQFREKTKNEVREEIIYNKKHRIKKSVSSTVEIGKAKVLEDVSFKIEPNTTVAFVGNSGSGKTTILNLVSKMYEADKGKVLIDGVNIKSLTKSTIRSAISLVNQFPYIFDMSIKENLLLAKPDATDEEINKAIEQSALTEFIEGLPDKLDTKVGESGVKLSGGQKQRLAIARVMLKQSKIVIFDESTSSLDNISQNQVKESIDNIKGQSTIIIVAHRLSTIRNVDKIFYLEKGRIADQGTFKELYKRNKSFKKMFLAEDIKRTH